MTANFAIIGFGEAGRTFATATVIEGAIRAFDVVAIDPDLQNIKSENGERVHIAFCESHADAVRDASIIFSLVTADQALNVARTTATSVRAGAIFCDMNSVAPETKRAGEELIAAAGGHYVDVAIMAPVNPARLDVPLLVSGRHNVQAMTALEAFGFTNIAAIEGGVGRASAIKMIRSVMIKGTEALTAEMILAARRAGVEEAVLHSLGPEWSDKANYNLERMQTHGERRAAEMEEVAKTLEALGVESLMTRGAIAWQRQMAARNGSEA
jgi:3-hydroxyisobutyrate dehydrogenase-like beta-hydroxyacid dehydrogenase